MSMNLYSGDNLMAVSDGDRAVVCRLLLILLEALEEPEGGASGGFNLRTSSRRTARIWSSRVVLTQPRPPTFLGGPEVIPRPITSPEERPTMASQRRSLSSRPRSEARE